MGKSPVDSLFTRYVEAGRLVRVRYGPLTGKMCTVVDLVDLKRIVVDGPTTGVKRQMMPIKWIELTDQKCTIERGAREKTLKKALAKDSPLAKWAQTKWAKKIAATDAKKTLTDMDRFKIMMAKKKISQAVKKGMKKSKK